MTPQTASFMSPGFNYGADIAEIERQRRLAQALQEQSLQPMGPSNEMAGGWVVRRSPFEGAGKLAQALAGSYGLKKAAADERGVVDRQNQDRSATMQAFVNALQGTPGKAGIEMPPEELGGGPGREAVAPVPGNPTAAYGELMKSQDPSLQQMGMRGIVDSSKPMVLGRSLVTPTGQTLAVDQTWQQEQQATRQQRMEELQLRLQDQRLQGQERAELQRQLQAERLQAQQDLIRLSASLRPPRQEAQPQVIQTEDGTFVIDRAGAEARPVTAPDGSPLRGKTDKPMTEFQGKAALYGTRAAQAHNILNGLEEKISTSGLATKQALQNVPVIGGALGAAGNVALSKDQQKVEQAQRDFVNAVLRQESGAVISDGEFKNAQRQYFNQPGDSKEVIAQKRANRDLAIKGFERMSGREGAAAINDIRQNQPLGDRRGGQAPAGVDKKLWDAMTEQERALWRK